MTRTLVSPSRKRKPVQQVKRHVKRRTIPHKRITEKNPVPPQWDDTADSLDSFPFADAELSTLDEFEKKFGLEQPLALQHSDKPAAPVPPVLPPRRKKVVRRRQIDPTTCERDYTMDEVEFMNALNEYKRSSGRMFPTCSEILEVLRQLGYEKQK
ncbi:MAG: hypothetical protein LBN39_01210 [Planctomycetaceae bacterium]|jgi:hypothetical protein|nr:hypothetical protein [Planctomycetaceae bacterium]